MQAATQKAAASVQPIRRGPMADAGSATATGRTKVSRAAVVAVAAWGATIPAKSTAKPTTAHRHNGRHLVRRHDGTEHGEAGADDVQPAVGDEPGARPPRELHQQEQREGTEGPEESDLGVREGHVGDGEHRRHDHGGPDRALEDEEIGVLRAEPAEETPARRRGSLGFGRERHGPAGVMVV